VGELDPRRTVAAERRPQPEHEAAGLEEADLVVGLPAVAPAERLVEGAGTGEIGDAERHEAEALFHHGLLVEGSVGRTDACRRAAFTGS